MLIQMAISRSREYLADATGAGFAGTPEGLARALEKTGGLLQAPADGCQPGDRAHVYRQPLIRPQPDESLSTHPPLEERIARLRGQRFTSPQPPPDSGSGRSSGPGARDVGPAFRQGIAGSCLQMVQRSSLHCWQQKQSGTDVCAVVREGLRDVEFADQVLEPSRWHGIKPPAGDGVLLRNFIGPAPEKPEPNSKSEA